MRELKLVDVAHVIMGQSPKGSSYNNKGIGTPLLNGPADFGLKAPVAVQWTTRPTKFAEPGDILFCVRGNTLGRQNTADQHYAIGRGLTAIRARHGKADTEFLGLWLNFKAASILASGNGSTFPSVAGPYLENLAFPAVDKPIQTQMAIELKFQLRQVELSRHAAYQQLSEISNFADAIVIDSVQKHHTADCLLRCVLDEVKGGIGPTWRDYPVMGATRRGLALAKEQPGKHPMKYKPVFAGTVFYNPMRILIGSIAFVDEDDLSGITSPDYVALRGKPGKVDSRWFYYWLRSPLGVQCINSLARGAVRERMLFNRLADGRIHLPDLSIQQRASAVLYELKSMKKSILRQLADIDSLTSKILSRAFEN